MVGGGWRGGSNPVTQGDGPTWTAGNSLCTTPGFVPGDHREGPCPPALSQPHCRRPLPYSLLCQHWPARGGRRRYGCPPGAVLGVKAGPHGNVRPGWVGAFPRAGRESGATRPGRESREGGGGRRTVGHFAAAALLTLSHPHGAERRAELAAELAQGRTTRGWGSSVDLVGECPWVRSLGRNCGSPPTPPAHPAPRG